jgi:hypothetical protein
LLKTVAMLDPKPIFVIIQKKGDAFCCNCLLILIR